MIKVADLNVRINPLHAIPLAWQVASEVAEHYGYWWYITAGYEGKHVRKSRHYLHLATDGDLVPRDTLQPHKASPETMRAVAAEIQKRLGPEFQVIYEPGDRDHIHIEFDPEFPEGIKT